MVSEGAVRRRNACQRCEAEVEADAAPETRLCWREKSVVQYRHGGRRHPVRPTIELQRLAGAGGPSKAA